jgi:adenine phosphoribosyltransferase
VATGLLDLKTFIRDVPDFPKKGIVFKDISPLLAHPGAFRATVEEMSEAARDKGVEKVVAIESRGFIFGSAIAQHLGVGFVPVRKKGKLPAKTLSATYKLEYGTDTLEIHADALRKGEKVLIVDDVLATGGTAQTTAELVRQTGADPVAVAFAIELTFLKGREKLKDLTVSTVLTY